MLDQKQILEYAVKGIKAEIDKLEKDIAQGKNFIKQLENGEKPKTNKTAYEIHNIIRLKREEIENLDKERFNLEWAITEMQ